MANKLGIYLGGKTVIFPQSTFRAEYKHLAGVPFKVEDGVGNGRFPDGMGGKLYGVFANGMADVMRGEEVLALVEDDPILDRIAVLQDEAEKEAKREEPVEGQPGTTRIIFGSREQINKILAAKLQAEGIIDADLHFVKGPCAPDAPKPKIIDHNALKQKAGVV